MEKKKNRRRHENIMIYDYSKHLLGSYVQDN